MFITEFPDIHWLRTTAKNGFKDQVGVNGMALEHRGWPSVVLNARSSGIERTNIKGTFSLFLNLDGRSLVTSSGRNYEIGRQNYALTNFGEEYNLIVPEGSTTTTFNIHFGEHLFKHTIDAIRLSHDQLIDNPAGTGLSYATFVKSRVRDEPLNLRIQRLFNFYKSDVRDQSGEEELLHDLLGYLVYQNEQDWQGLRSIGSLKKSTREELMKRLRLSCDYIHQNYQKEITLEEISKASMLSKFHYLRTFKEAFGCTPQAYRRRIQMDQAKQLLTKTNLPIRDVSLEVGYSEPNAFIKSFSRSFGISPGGYRAGA